ncbi:hypothetical protein T484DRAFT_1894999 [Baffinella frigidus]|nr:hypothetical protein T484DRAFT_1894999 [Cryptophyta sp. CCMP2293]
MESSGSRRRWMLPCRRAATSLWRTRMHAYPWRQQASRRRQGRTRGYPPRSTKRSRSPCRRDRAIPSWSRSTARWAASRMRMLTRSWGAPRSPSVTSAAPRIRRGLAPRCKRAEDLERQLESVKGLQQVTKERLTGKEREAELLRDDLQRKVTDLEHVTAERNKLRDEVQRARFNSGLGGAAPAPVVVMAPAPGAGGGGGGGGAAASEHDAAKAQEAAVAYRRAQQEMGDLNAYLIQVLDDLSKREEELAATGEELARYKEDLGVLRVQQVLLYKEHTGRVAGLETEVAKLVRQWNEEKHRADLEASKATSALEKLLSLSQQVQGSGGPAEVVRMQKDLVEAERRVILLQADHDMTDRVSQVRKEEEHELRARYDALVVDMTRQEQRLKQRIGQLDRSKLAAETRLGDCQRLVANSVPKEEASKLRSEYLLLKEKHSAVMNRDSKALLERASAEGFKQRAERLATEQQEMKLQLAEASDRAAALASRLEQLALREGPPEQQQLPMLSEKLVRLEVSERNAVRQKELAQERMRSFEKDSQRLQERIAALEEENVEAVARGHELEESFRELRSRMEGSVSAEQAKEMRGKMTEQDSEIVELKINSSKFQEVADLATDQAKAMEELHTMQLDELEALRAYVSQVQSQSDDQAEIGMLHRRILDRERQVHELTSKVTSLDKELVRMDEYVVRLEDTLEKKSEVLFKFQDESSAEVKRLERAVEDLKNSAAGQIPLEKADQWAASLRDLTEQKQSAAEDLSVAKKKAEEADERAETLQIQLDDTKALVKTLRDEVSGGTRAGGGGPVEKLTNQVEEMTRLKLENLRLARQSRQLQEREAHLEQNLQHADAEARRLEERLVALQQDQEAAEADQHLAKEVQSREEYMAQKELDNETIEQLREALSKKTQEAIQGMRARAQPQAMAGPGLGGLLAEKADAALAEKDSVIQSLNAELQSLKRKTEDLLREREDFEVVAKEAKEDTEKAKDKLDKADAAKKPSQVLETLVFKLKKQLKDKEKKQEDMKAAIESLREEMLKAADTQAAQQVAALQAAAEPAAAGTEAAVAEQSAKLKHQIEELEAKLKRIGAARTALGKDKEELQTKLEELEKKKIEAERRLALDVKKAQAATRKAQEELKKSEEAATESSRRLSELEKRMKEAESKSKVEGSKVAVEGSKVAVARRGIEVAPGREGGDGREEATRRWEAEKRLEGKVERLTTKLREHRKEMEALEKRAGSDKEKAEREADKLRQHIEILQEDKKNLKAHARGAGGQLDSEEVLTRVRDAEGRVKALEEDNEKLHHQLEVEARQTASELRQKVSQQERKVKEARDDKDRADEHARAAEGEGEAALADLRQKEIRRLEGEVTRLRGKEEALEADLLASHNQVVRLRFDSEHSELRLIRWQRRVRELESLPLAVGAAGDVGAGGKKKAKEEEEMERFVRNTKIAMEKLHKENEALRAQSTTNQKYMDMVRENKTLKSALADRDRELVALNDKLSSMRDQVEKKGKVDEKLRARERELKLETERANQLADTVTERDRRVNRLESELAAARDSAGGDGFVSDRVREVAEEADALRVRLKAAERDKVSAEKEAEDNKWALRQAEKRGDEAQSKLAEEVRRMPVGGGGAAAGGARSRGQDSAEAGDMARRLRELQEENDELKAELNSFDPAFWDDIEDLKYNHNEMVKLVDRYEALLSHLSSKYGFEFTPQSAAAPRRTVRR